jgi:hypothetical protein
MGGKGKKVGMIVGRSYKSGKRVKINVGKGQKSAERVSKTACRPATPPNAKPHPHPVRVIIILNT